MNIVLCYINVNTYIIYNDRANIYSGNKNIEINLKEREEKEKKKKKNLSSLCSVE